MTVLPGPGADPGSPLRLLALADSDSYLKWTCATLDRLGADLPDASRSVWLIRSPLLPTAEQETAARAGLRWLDELPVVGPAGLRARIARLRPDVVLVGATGPVAELALTTIARMPRRPAVVTGLPGIALPATAAALRYRAGADALLVHSRAERYAYGSLGRRLGQALPTVLTRLPFLPDTGLPEPSHRPVNRVVFAAQAMFPQAYDQRIHILDALARLAVRRPDVRVVVKLRARPGERQTHDEAHPYDELWHSYSRAAGFDSQLLQFGHGPMVHWLTPGAALVTVSSTAALESVGLGLPTMILTDFGLTEELLNAPFAESGLLGTLADAAAGRFTSPHRQWLRDHWFHPEPSELPDWVTWLAARARAGTLAPARRGVPVPRTWLRSALPATVTRMVWAVRRAS